MTEHQRNKRANQKQQDAPGRPSQAEGDRDTIEQDLGERPNRGSEGSTDPRTQDSAPSHPSQAEGDRDTVEQDLGEQKKKTERGRMTWPIK